MSKDMLGSVIRAAVGVPQKRLDLLAKIASKFADDNPEGDGWHKHLGKTVNNGLPDAKPVAPAEEPKNEPTIIELGEFEVNYDESIAQKLAGIIDPKCVGWRTDWATDDKFPDARKGKKRFKASAVNFGRLMPDEGDGSIAEWCANNKKIRATPKEGIDLAKVSPRPKLDNVMPLAMAGQFFVHALGNRRALYLFHDGDGRLLDCVWLVPDGQWNDDWWFLVLEELPLEA